MTTLALIAAFVATFVIGFLLGDRRGVRQANAILDANMRDLFKAITDERAIPVDDDREGDRPIVH